MSDTDRQGQLNYLRRLIVAETEADRCGKGEADIQKLGDVHT